MPSSMIHILTAYKYNKNANILFFVGNLAPDSVNERVVKDQVHFRDKENRYEALSKFSKNLDLSNDFNIGVILHLFLDCMWDKKPQKQHRDNFKGVNWFSTYRIEIVMASAYLFHHTELLLKEWH